MLSLLAPFILVSAAKAVLELPMKQPSTVSTYFSNRTYVVRKNRPYYHISGSSGWLNEPSAFVHYKNKYHIFYQFQPNDALWETSYWGHVVSEDLVDWTHEVTALVAKEDYERYGCLAGSAVSHKDYLSIFYTGNARTWNDTIQSQNIAISTDGVQFRKYIHNPILLSDSESTPKRRKQEKFSPNASEFKNPKVWKFSKMWYMLVGTSTADGKGAVLLYSSVNMFRWHAQSVVAQSHGDTGYVWENPDLFRVDGQDVLLLTAKGVPVDGVRIKNPFQTGYFIGKFNYSLGQFEDVEVSLDTFNILDYGHDFYAVKTMLAPDGRRLLVGWLGIWNSHFQEQNAWVSCLSVIREVNLNSQDRVLMNPLKEMNSLRVDVMEDAWYRPGESFFSSSRVFEMIVEANTVASDIMITFEWGGDANSKFSIAFHPKMSMVLVDRGGPDGIRKAAWSPNTSVYLRIYVDTSSVEVFCGYGEVVLSSRVYPKKCMRVGVGGDTNVHIVQYKLRRNLVHDKFWRNFGTF